LLLVTDSETAAIHEARAGRINRHRLENVRLDEEAEKRLPPPKVEGSMQADAKRNPVPSSPANDS
jgi:hypothetical protein